MTTSVKTRKTCFKCKIEKPLTEFYVHPAMGEGRLNKCKECTRRDVQENYRANISHYKEYEKGRARLSHRVEARRSYSKNEAGRKAHRRAHARYYYTHADRRAAHIAVGNAVRDGKLIRQSCEVCGAPKAQAHHDDYSKPLKVRWLCRKHHLEHHGKAAI